MRTLIWCLASVHQPSLTLAKESVSYGWQATRRLSTVAAKQRRWTPQVQPANRSRRARLAQILDLLVEDSRPNVLCG
jgi:hypothetical protein